MKKNVFRGVLAAMGAGIACITRDPLVAAAACLPMVFILTYLERRNTGSKAKS